MEDLTQTIFRAIKEKNLDLVKNVLSQGVDVNAKYNDGWTALIKSSMIGKIEIAKLLIEKGASVTTKDIEGQTALMKATMNVRQDAIKILRQADATE